MKERLERLAAGLPEGADAALITSGVSRRYLTGMASSAGRRASMGKPRESAMSASVSVSRWRSSGERRRRRRMRRDGEFPR